MARPKNTSTTQLAEDVPLAGDLQLNLNAMTEHRLQIMAQFGDGLPYERERIVHEARFYMAQSAEAMLEAGKRLIILKENEPHGDFSLIITEQLGMAERTARLMMQAAVKYHSPQLESKRQALAVLGKTKLFELMTEDDEELAELADGGTIAGMTLDDIDRMTSRELKAALRETREDLDAKRRTVAEKDEKINELKETREKLKRLPVDVAINELRGQLSDLAEEMVRKTMGSITDGFARLDEDTLARGVPHTGFMAGLLLDIEREIQCLRSRFDLPELPVQTEPEWINGPTEDDKNFQRPDFLTDSSEER
ncbi:MULTISPECIES: DUF3102 domain-containing protein [unclassified Serratia (in: enterobacteria)]|uniref:DUF3102 domain-containing protein n=1 Tax=unclassified Serratia (in: enterobacteria) TaxID=2647522 RepID=UPI0005034977|nr:MULTISPECIES: DUF3102 domain-containing protein [unclassified Serratia (in: enterobacteria)]KFK92749.1 phage protein [Serratia sp. Ag2]KFK96520.1 phage protein [Serratia sp. Ag1]